MGPIETVLSTQIIDSFLPFHLRRDEYLNHTENSVISDTPSVNTQSSYIPSANCDSFI